MGTTVPISRMPAHHPLHRSGSSSRANVADPARFCETADVPAGFRSDMCKHVGFTVSRHEKGEKVMGKINMQTMPPD